MSVTPKQITGNWYYAGGVPVAGATLTLTLSQSAVFNDGSGSVAPNSYYIILNSEGGIPNTAEIYYNDELLPNGTYYTWTITQAGKTIFGPVSGQIVATAPVSLNTIPPLSNVVPPVPAPSVFGPLTVVQPTGTNLHVVVDNESGGGSSNITEIGGSAIALGQTTKSASLPVTIASDQGSLAVTGTFWQTTQPVSGTFWQTTQPVSGGVSVVTSTSGGSSTFFYNGTGGSSAQTIKSSAGQIDGYFIGNTANSATTYVQFFDATSVTVGSTSPKFVLEIPAGLGANLALDPGIQFPTGIMVAITTTASGSTAVSSAVNFTAWYA